MQRSLSLATDNVERILKMLESQSKTIYDRSSLVAIQLPLLKGAKNVVRGEGIVWFWEGWFGRKGGGAFERVVGMARFDAAILPS